MLLTFLNEPFIIRALWASIPIAILSGLIGTLIVSKRMLYVSGSISHAIFGGIALGVLFQDLLLSTDFKTSLDLPIIGAFSVAIGSASLVSILSNRHPEKQDVLLSLLWAVGISSGIIFLSLSTRFTSDLTILLFGDLFLITNYDIFLIAIPLILTAIFIACFYKKIQLIFLDENYAKLKDIPVTQFNFLILLIISSSIVVLLQSVGITMVIALFSLGSATAIIFTHTLFQSMIVSFILNLIYLVTGIFISVLFDIPVTPAVILIAGFLYLTGELLNLALKSRK